MITRRDFLAASFACSVQQSNSTKPSAIIPSGDYTVDGKTVIVTVVLSGDDNDPTSKVEGNLDDTDALAVKIVQKILEASATAHH